MSTVYACTVATCVTGDAGGERGNVGGGLIHMMGIIGPPHLGHFHKPETQLSSGSASAMDVSGADPRHWKQSGNSFARFRFARYPKLRMRTKPFGSR